MKLRKRIMGGLTAFIMTAQCLLGPAASIPVHAASSELPNPVLALDFENLVPEAGTDASGDFTAATGQTVTVHDKVTVQEGKDGGKGVLLDNASGKTGYLTTPNTDALNPEDITVSVWIKRKSTTNNTEGRILWNKELKETNSEAWQSNGWFFGWTTGESMAFVTNGPNMAVQKGNSDDLIPAEEWTNLTATFDSSTGVHTIYKNGKVFSTNTVAGASITKNANAADLMIGKSGYGDAGIGCVLDDIQIYDQALSARQVGELAGISVKSMCEDDLNSLHIPSRASGDFTLPVKGANGSSITWTSDNEAIVIGENGKASVLRGDADVNVKLTAKAVLEDESAEKVFSVTVVKNYAETESLQKLGYDEIIDVQGTVGARLKEGVQNYAMNYLYGKGKLDGYLNEYQNHSHSSWSWLEGEQPGKWLESVSNARWMDKNGEIKAAITHVVDRLSETQTKENRSATGYNQFAGYLGNGTAQIRNSKPVKGMDPYEMYSTLNGLISVYENYKTDDKALSDKALNCAIGLADYLTATIGDENTYVTYQDGSQSNVKKAEFWPNAITNGVTIAGHDVHQGWEGTLLIDPVMRLAKDIEDSQSDKTAAYSQWVDWTISNIDKWASVYKGYGDTPYADLDKVAEGTMGIDAVQHYVHAHTFQMNFLGFLKKYQETGDETYLNKVMGAWNDISARQKYITGTVSVGEHYEAGHNLPNTGHVGETCATNSWTLLNNNLFEISKEAKYQQTVEDLIFNHMFATSTIDGDGYSYHRPLNGDTSAFYTGTSGGKDASYPDCCSSSGMRMQSYVPYYIYSKSDTEVYVNQFIQSEANIKLNGGTFHIKQTTDYPKTDKIQLEVLEGSKSADVNIRVPEWVKNPSVKVNGQPVSVTLKQNTYMTVNLKAGDEVEITYPSELTWVKGTESNDGLWAIKKGPMVYCMAAAFLSVEESNAAFGSDVAAVNLASVVEPKDGEAVETIGEPVAYEDDHILGQGYRIKAYTGKGEQEVTIVPYANVGQWYRYGTKPEGSLSDYTYLTSYQKSVRYPYVIWMSGDADAYPEKPQEKAKPVVHYTFDSADLDGTTVKDISGNGKDAVLKGSAVTQRGGKFGERVSLNGTDAYVELPKDILYGLHDMSISMWINPDELGSWARIFDFGSVQDPPYPNLFATMNSGSNNLRFAYETGMNTKIDAGAVVKTGMWQNLVVTISGTKAQMYLNGEKVGENNSFNYVPFTSSRMVNNFLGKSNYSADKYYKGGMDDFRIYNRALPEKEIEKLALENAPTDKVNLEEYKVLDMSFDDNSVKDSTGTNTPKVEGSNIPTYIEGHNGTGKAFETNRTRINLGNSELLQPKNLTVSMWIKAPEGGFGTEEHILFWNKEQAKYDSDGWYLTSTADNALFLEVGATDGSRKVYTGGVKVQQGGRDAFFPAGEWVHVAVTYNDATQEMSFYRNGEKQVTTIADNGTSRTINATKVDKYIGESGYGRNDARSKLAGAIDDVKLYSAVATEDDVKILCGTYMESHKILNMNFDNEDISDSTGTAQPTLVSGTPNFAEGHNGEGKAIEFNNAKINLGSSTTLQPEDLTVSFWAKAPEGGYKGEQILFWCKPQAGFDKAGWYLCLNNKGALKMGVDGDDSKARTTAMSSSDFFPEGEWVQVTVVYDSEEQNIHFYRNGMEVEKTNKAATTGISTSEGDKYMGQSGYEVSNMTGMIDDVQLYDVAATKEQVEELCGLDANKKLEEAKEALVFGDDNRLFYDTVLQSKGLWDSVISWAVKGTSDAITIEGGNKAKVTRGKEDATVTLTATLTLDGVSVKKDFEITIPDKTRESVAKAVTFNNVILQDEFWSAKQKSFLCKVLETGITNIEKYRGGIDNLRNAAMKNGKLEKDDTYDRYFRSGEKQDGYADNLYFLDTDPYKMIEAMSYALQIDPNGDEEIISQQNRFKEKLNTWIPWIEGAQETYTDEEGNPADNAEQGKYDGYLDTYYTLDMASNPNRPEKLINFHLHEMYVFGHFYEAAVAYTRATQYEDLRLLDVAVRNADMMVRLFGNGKWESYPGHQEIELALIKLALVCEEVGTREGMDYASRSTEYVNLAKFFLDKRGYPMNHGDFGGAFSNDPYYRQTHAPVAEQTTAVGHAVRAMYQYSAMTDVETLMDSDTYDKALHAIWDDLQTKTYVTGGIGSKGSGSSSEGFGSPYYLPNNNAYAETCANIGSMMWSQRMNLLYGDASYADTMETALYNSVISGVNFDGDKFFYQNPMSSTGNQARSAWFGCACCPPNLMRTITSLGGYIYAQDEASVAVNLYIGNKADITVGGKNVTLELETDMPWYGTSKMTVKNADNVKFAMKLRIPSWADGANKIAVNGTAVSCDEKDLEQGYVVIDRTWKSGDEITIDFPMETEKYHSDERVVTNKGLAAVKRGPVVYAAEGKDNAFDAGKAYLGNAFTEKIETNVLTNADTSAADVYGIKKGMVIRADGKAVNASGDLEDVEWTFIPYYAWNNRGSDTMNVFVNDIDSFNQYELIAKKAKVDTVYYNPSFNQADKMNDGDKNTFWCCWKEKEVITDPWVSYTFEDTYKMSACVVNWYDDGGGAQVPKGLVIEYRDANGEWKEVTPAGTYDTFTKDVDNTYKFEPVVTKEIRMTMKNEGIAATAIREWNLIAEEVNDPDLVDKTALKAAIDDAVPESEKDQYTEKTWDAYAKALAHAKDVYGKENAKQSEVNAAAKALTDEQDALRKKDGEKPEVLAEFDFDDETSGFTNGFGVAKGTYSLQKHDNGKALYLNGTGNFLEVQTKNGNSLLAGEKELTVSFQAKPDSSSTNWLFFAAPNDKTQEYSKETYVGILDDKSSIVAERYKNATARPTNPKTTVAAGQWYHLTVVYAEKETIIYVNGEEKARQASSYALPDILGDDGILYIGKANWVNGEYYKGLVDNYKITGRALTAEEVKAEADKYADVPAVDKKALKEAIDNAIPESAKDQYTTGTWDVYAKALKDAKDVYAKADAKQSEVNAATKALTEAQDALEKKGEEKPVDKSTLEKALKGAVLESDKDKYTEDTWKVYAKALEDAKKVNADKNADQAQVDAVVKALTDAQKALAVKKASDVFKDVDEKDWFTSYVQYVFENRYMTGLTKDTFGPAEILSRAQFATILYRIEGSPEVEYKDIFPDVKDGEFYTDAVMWASETGVVSGYADKTFGPADQITREQLATMMYRYAQEKKYDITATDDLKDFDDAGQVSEFALKAMKWAVGSGIISGNEDGTLAPQGDASRAVCAAIIQRFMENVKK